MVRILLLDCADALYQSLKAQGFHVESGTIGFSTGYRLLPSQVYEHDIVIYNPVSVCVGSEGGIRDSSPDYDLKWLKDHVLGGATILAFINRVCDDLEIQSSVYSWIPFMPSIQFTRDRLVYANSFSEYPESNCAYLAPIAVASKLDIPVLCKLLPPKPREYPRDAFAVFQNRQGDTLGLHILRGRGGLIFLPKFKSNEEIVDTFLHRVVPKVYDLRPRVGLVDTFRSPAEQEAQAQIEKCERVIASAQKALEGARVKLAEAGRSKAGTIDSDITAKQIVAYYDMARRQDDAALFYLYKALESIENAYGGEAKGISALGLQSEWKLVKRVANASYGDIRHAPKPGDAMKKWSDEDIKKCFAATESIILTYFATLFAVPPQVAGT